MQVLILRKVNLTLLLVLEVVVKVLFVIFAMFPMVFTPQAEKKRVCEVPEEFRGVRCSKVMEKRNHSALCKYML